MKTSSLIKSLMSCGFFLAAVGLQAEQKQPNVVILYADDMGYGDLGIQNPNSKIPTPHLDQLASEGMRFTDGHSSSGICTLSRYALLTGRYHWRKMHGIVHAFGESVFDAEEQTLPEMLQEQGYYTACIGKWHLGWDWDAIRKPEAGPVEMDARGVNKLPHFSEYNWDQSVPDGPLAHGFDHYFGDTVINFPPYAWIEDDKLTQAPTLQKDEELWKPLQEGNWECRVGPMVEGWDPYEVLPELTRRAVSFVEGRQDEEEPFFLFMAFPAPHAPIVPSAEFEGTSEAGPYGDFMVQTDWSCGQILDALKRSGLEEDTIVIFTADNGAEHYAYPRALKYDHWSSEPFRGLKRDTYEGGHHVPFLVKWPGVVEPGSVSEAIISQVDLMATLGEVAKAKIQQGAAEDSRSQLPVLTGEAAAVRTEIVHNTSASNYAVRRGDWVLIDAPSGDHNRKRSGEFEEMRGYPADDGQPVELFNLRNDPSQRRNVAKEYPEKVQELQALLKRIRKMDS
ncbi:arylsulfatase [Pelagicoccus sp. SDUM812005]|uniref:sulfatase family protein n=1 Tax=Pelagicoccus sp. SDUM812005 TaxID=3041257 RepID=UPI00280E7EDE|nr:arylsulfatase [Pelagicoccus sp. SDUM812005]MDQ8180259.1 arylsulfatase [Pelagicoccus sp. SDUM812005]